MAFVSKVYDAAECDYKIYEDELVAIVRYFECWKTSFRATPPDQNYLLVLRASDIS